MKKNNDMMVELFVHFLNENTQIDDIIYFFRSERYQQLG